MSAVVFTVLIGLVAAAGLSWLMRRSGAQRLDALAGEHAQALGEIEALNTALLTARREAGIASRQAQASRDRADDLLARAARATLEPLSSARAMSAGLRADPPGQPPQRRRLDVLEESLTRAQAACEDLAQLSRAGAPAARLRRVDPLIVVDRVAHRYREGARARGIDLRHPAPEPQLSVWADPERLDRVLSALVDNAIRYNREGGLVMIEARRGSNGLTLYVHDSGRGVEEAQIDGLFDPFAAEPCGARRGVGLAVARRLARSMGGEVRLDSALGEGSTASVRLKLAQPEPVEAPVAPPRPRLTLVHIDADPVSRGVVRHHCDAVEGAALHQDAAIDSGLALARDLRPDAVILSLSSQPGDAGEVRRRLDAEPDTRGLPLIVIARLDALPVRRTAGVNEWLDLPLEGRAFTAALMRVGAHAERSQAEPVARLGR